MTSTTYNNVWASLLKRCQDFILDFKMLGLSENLQIIDWDAHANIEDLPPVDLLGPSGLGMMYEKEGEIITFTIGVATYQDDNLFMLRRMVGLMYDALLPEKQFTIYDHETLKPLMPATIVEASVSPVSKSEVRALQLCQFEARLGSRLAV